MSGSATPLDTISAEWSPDKFRFVESKDKQAPLCKSKCTPPPVAHKNKSIVAMSQTFSTFGNQIIKKFAITQFA
jgi:hypothetical protein